jgi:protein-tyrosine phosphatase
MKIDSDQNLFRLHIVLALLVCSLLLVTVAGARAQEAPLDSYERLLPLQGGSNFRDMGGYQTSSGETVARGMLFRSGAMVSLTESDMDYLEQFNFQTIVDLRSKEEVDLYPNYWVRQTPSIDYISVEYSMLESMGEMMSELSELDPEDIDMSAIADSMGAMYRGFPEMLKPQLTSMFDSLLRQETPLVVNCSAGQDRTGFASAVVLSVLGVPRDTIIEDYHLSTQFRRPDLEAGDVDLEEAAKTNGFAAMMLQFSGDEGAAEANPLYTGNGVSYLQFALQEIDARYGSVEAYLQQELGVDGDEIQQLKNLYLQ